MTMNGTNAPRKPLRLWPGVAAAVLLVLVRIGIPVVAPQVAIYGMLGAVACALAIIVWWVFFSRAPWPDRVGAIVFMALALAATGFVVHESVANGFMGMMLPIFGIPVLCVALVASAAAGRRLPPGPRRALIAAGILLACGSLALVRTGGISGEGQADLHWRWTPTPEERLLAQDRELPPAAPAPAPPRAIEEPTPAPEVPSEQPRAEAAPKQPARPAAPAKRAAEWPGFRGPHRDSVIKGLRIETDWTASPPIELWRRAIGPGWSSFAVQGELVYTQEQRGEDEIVSCYRLTTGEPVWSHRDPVRFWESNGGAGPRATPTLHDGRVYTVGATGVVNALDARNGARFWSRDAVADTGKEIPGWGIASSPVVIDDLVIVAINGRLVAYEIADGNLRWLGPEGGGGYSSPHLATIDGVPQILLLRGARTLSVAPADGKVLWEHVWEPGVSIVQPAVTPNGDVLVVAGDAMGGVGMRRIAAARRGDGWTIEERWTTRGLKPYFNDFVVHEGHAYGFDGSILASINLEDGARAWKGGRYGHGQMVLLPDQDLLLILSEEGELALVSATPDRFTEVARIPAIEGKTWNHPVLVGGILLVRNGEEMAAFRLPIAGRRVTTAAVSPSAASPSSAATASARARRSARMPRAASR